MKVVQLLYSYLLTRNDFKLAPEPKLKTRDSEFGYETYLNMILLLQELSGNKIGKSSFSTSQIGPKLSMKLSRALAQNAEIKALINNGTDTISDYDSVVAGLYDAITNSTVFNDFNKKRNKGLPEEIVMWNVLIDTVISKNQDLMTAARRCDNFTQSGFAQGIELLKITLNEYVDNKESLDNACKSLTYSLDKAYELYHLLLLIPVELTRIQNTRLEIAKDKYIPTSSDLNPNTRFIDNAFVKSVMQSEQMAEYLKEHPIDLEPHYLLLKRLLDDILQSNIYASYMDAATNDCAADCEFWRNVMKNIILPSDALAEILEGSSIYWNDDLDIMGTFVLKTIKRTAGSPDCSLSLLPQYKDDDDAQFGSQLFTDIVKNRETYRSYIDRFIDTKQWDTERIAFMDIVVMMTAISELLNFPAIPIPVTLNEYIEIANSYSTPRSGQFVNGMLFSIINYLKDEGKLNKN